MCSIPHAQRIAGRYVYRRRVHFRNIISKPLTIALRTADPAAARQRAAMLSARFVTVNLRVKAMMQQGAPLTGEQIEEIFRRALEDELSGLLNDAYSNESWSDSVTDVAADIAEACRILRRPNRPMSPRDSRRDEPPIGEHSHLSGAEFYAAQILSNLGDEQVAALLKALGVSVHAGIIEPTRTHILRGMGKGAELAQRAFDDDVLDAPDPMTALTAELGPRQSSMSAKVIPYPTVSAATAIIPQVGDCQFVQYDTRKFSAVIEEILTSLKLRGVWKSDFDQKRRIMETFAWITGDKALGDYTHLDVADFVSGLLQLPKKRFRYGSFSSGAMSRPFADVIAELPKVNDASKRHLKTLNRDLSTMQTVSNHLEKSSWKARIPGVLVLNFGKSRERIKRGKEKPWPPWRKEHLRCLFKSPIYTGGGGALRRLKDEAEKRQIWHDAAYYAPLIWYYTAACWEEICGLEIQDVVLDHSTPHFHIRDNLTRGRDGEMAGEKTEARNRRLPIPTEVLRLGFADYVSAISSEGHLAVFPELYRNAEKRGGGFFYDRAWQHMVCCIADRMELPKPVNGKGADIHSIRSLGSSAFEVDGVNDIVRADVMGHSRQGTNAESYSQREKTEGLDVILAERLAFMNRYIPTITDHLDPAPIRLLPIDQRSRVGSPRVRKRRSEAKTVEKD